MRRSLQGGAPWDVFSLRHERDVYNDKLSVVAPFVEESIADACAAVLSRPSTLRVVKIGDALRWEPWRIGSSFPQGIEGYLDATLKDPLHYLARIVVREYLATAETNQVCVTSLGVDGRAILGHAALRLGVWWRPLAEGKLDVLQQVELYGVGSDEQRRASLTRLQLHTSQNRVTDLSVGCLDDRTIALEYRQRTPTKRYTIEFADLPSNLEQNLPRYTPLPSLVQLHEVHRDLDLINT